MFSVFHPNETHQIFIKQFEILSFFQLACCSIIKPSAIVHNQVKLKNQDVKETSQIDSKVQQQPKSCKPGNTHFPQYLLLVRCQKGNSFISTKSLLLFFTNDNF